MLWIRRGGSATRAQTALLGSLFLTIAYTASGKLALLLAVTPGYASPIFPPAGIAVAAMLIAGRSTLPWTFLGSFLLNLWTGYSVGPGPGPMTVAAASAIAAASTLQAAIGGTVLRRTIGYPTALDNGRDLTRFLTLPPVFCLTSATLSLGGLFPLGLVRTSDLATNWVSWWIGDTLGVLVVLPLVLVMAGEPRSLWRGRAVPVALPMALFVALFVAIFVRVDEWEHDAALLEFRLLSQQIVDKIRTGLEEQEVFLEQLERAFTRPVALSSADFQHLVQNRLQQFPMTQAVEWAPRVDATARASFERAQRANLPGFEIREADPSGHLQRAGPRATYYPVTYVEPLRGNQEAVGFDLGSQHDRKVALERAIQTDRIAATAPIRLVQETAEQEGILLLYPVHSSVNGTGVLLVVHRMGTFLDGLLASVRPMVRVRLIDLDANKVLYGGPSPAATGAVYRTAFTLGGRDYGVETTPTPLYLERHRSWQSWVVLSTGVIGTGLLGGLLLLGTGYARRIETVVEQRTRDLAAVNDRLQREVKEREQAEAALHQAQKMEAIGQLTGGIAHDFNNLLTVVSGNAALLHSQAPNDTVARRTAAIVRAAEQGERLTRQLLAFSRRQTLRAETVDLRQRTPEIIEMLSRALRGDIELTVEIPDEVWPITVDPAEFELALLNVGVNARDAMPNGGRFRVAARNITFSTPATGEGLTGDFVAFRLSDTGGGMSAEVSAHAFEPFFTTKEVGSGSGLGLSQVYGFARQSGGGALIDSKVGAGTTITLYLPRARTIAGAPRPSKDEDIPPALPARILHVEDDGAVAQVTAELLRDFGCSVVRARDGKDALAMLERDPTIELVISDIVMPGGMSGLELARTLRERNPRLPVLLTSGYSRSALQAINEGFTLVEKPYRRNELAASIRAVLESGEGRPGISSRLLLPK